MTRLNPTTTGISCWACGGGPVRPSRRFGGTALLECPRCGLAFGPGLEEVYDEAYFDAYAGEGYDEAEAQRRHEARRRLRWMTAWSPPPARLLEVGAASGFFLEEARRAGYDGWGVEPSAREAERGRARGLAIVTGTVQDVELPRGVDVACAWHVLEHIAEPRAALEAVFRALRPGGHCFVEVPNADSWAARRSGARWPLLCLPGHVSQFGPASLAALATRAGFEPREIDTVAMYSYQRPAEALRLRRLAGRLAVSALSRTLPHGRHPETHELLRAVLRRP